MGFDVDLCRISKRDPEAGYYLRAAGVRLVTADGLAAIEVAVHARVDLVHHV